jgi:hypothetical protein
VTRHRGEATRRRGDQLEALPSSPSEIGRLLRVARERRGLDLLTVHDRLGRPITQLEALETGDLNALPDQAAVLSTLRRYAAYLALDGDALALALMEAWSTTTGRPRRLGRDVVPATGVVTAVSAEPDHLRAFTQTGQVPLVAGPSTSAAGDSGAYEYGVVTGPPTGMLTVVPRDEIKETRRASAKARRRRRAALPLRICTWLVALLAVAAIAGVVIQRQRPQWMVEAHLLRISPPPGQPRTAVATAPVIHHAVHHATHHAVGPVAADPSNSSIQATYSVAAQRFTVGIATSAPCWVQVTSPASIAPLLVGVLPSGTTKTFAAQGSISIQVGSSAVAVRVSIKGKTVFVNTPRVAPFTYTFTSTGQSPVG